MRIGILCAKVEWNTTVQVRKLVDRELQTPLFSSFLKGDFFHLKIKSWHPIKVHE